MERVAAWGTDRLVTVFGGSGFLGRHVVRQLAARGYRIRVAVRRPELAGFLQPYGGVGQIHAVQANLRYPDSVNAALKGADAVVNLVGILFESGRQRFDAVQASGASAVARAAAAAGIRRLVHVSAIGADAASRAAYARSKAAGEASVLAAFPDAVILRPSIVFGPEDDFFNQFAAMAGLSPVLPLLQGGKTRFQPVYVVDVASAVTKGIDGALRPGTVYELGGPDVESFRELLRKTLRITHRKRLLLPIPGPIATLQAMVFEWLPKPLLTRDQLEMLKTDNVVSEAAKAEGRTLEGMGIQPAAMDAILPTYLWRFRRAGQFARPADAQNDQPTA